MAGRQVTCAEWFCVCLSSCLSIAIIIMRSICVGLFNATDVKEAHTHSLTHTKTATKGRLLKTIDYTVRFFGRFGADFVIYANVVSSTGRVRVRVSAQMMAETVFLVQERDHTHTDTHIRTKLISIMLKGGRRRKTSFECDDFANELD